MVQLESALQKNPADVVARGKLLEHYFRGGVTPGEAIPARRRHILWLIRNAPNNPLAGGPSATIDASGHPLADPAGYRAAADAWREQVAKPDAKAQTLLNAAYFFKLSDRSLTAQLLERAIALDGSNAEAGARLGDHYAATILGVTMVNGNGFPAGVNPAVAKSPAAQRARAALETSQNKYVLAKAGHMLSFQGALLRGQLEFDPFAVANQALDRAAKLAPNDGAVAAVIQQARQLQQQARAAP